MKKYIFAFAVSLFCSTIANAQLYVDNSGKVGVGQANILSSTLTVGPCFLYQQTLCNIGLAATPSTTPSYMNVGLEGVVNTHSGYPLSYNHGVRGVVDANYYSNSNLNYGVTGIFSGTGSAGGTGIYGSSMFSSYYTGPDIQGKYAGYFDGDVYVSGNLSATQVTTTSDIRLKENVEDFGNGSSAMDNILGLKVLEYNLKYRGDYDVTDENALEVLREERPEVLEEIERRKEEFTSKRHYGISAQELLEIYPNLVDEGADGYYSVNYVEIVPVLIRCIQELKQELDELRASGDSTINKLLP